MEIKKIYKSDKVEEVEYIYLLDDGRKIIKRDKSKIKKLNIRRWDEVNFIPAYYKEINRKIKYEEKKDLKKFLEGHKNFKNKGLWNKIISFFK